MKCIFLILASGTSNAIQFYAFYGVVIRTACRLHPGTAVSTVHWQ